MRLERKCKVGVLILAFVLMLGFYVGGGQSAVNTVPPAPPWFVPCFKLPDKVDFCGEPVPIAASEDVRERFDREFTIVTQSHAQVYLWLKRKERYFPRIEGLLSRMGLPDDLKYVAVAESDLTPYAVSQAGAVGPWQFMSGTACRYGMICNAQVDDRYDFAKAGAAAFQYLKQLHDLFHSWTLAAAAYNCGEKRVQAAMELDKATSYYDLVLPRETERYVFRILAIKEVMTNPAQYGYYLPKGFGYPPASLDRVPVSLPGPMPISAAAEAAGVTYRTVKLLNPELISSVIPGGDCTVRVPKGRAEQFRKGVAAWKAAYKPVVVVYKVCRGESLDSIAHKFNVTKVQLCKWNHIEGNKIRIGREIKIFR
ncbi:MAG: transglycosylase SLT domain-containing protein [Syntrophobacteraceae bacterium]